MHTPYHGKPGTGAAHPVSGPSVLMRIARKIIHKEAVEIPSDEKFVKGADLCGGWLAA